MNDSFKAKILRFMLLLAGGLIGAALAVLYMAVFWEKYESAPHDSFQSMMYPFQATVIFIATVYNVGYFGMRLLKIHDQAQEIRKNQKTHMLLLNGCFALIFVCSLVYN